MCLWCEKLAIFVLNCLPIVKTASSLGVNDLVKHSSLGLSQYFLDIWNPH